MASEEQIDIEEEIHSGDESVLENDHLLSDYENRKKKKKKKKKREEKINARFDCTFIKRFLRIVLFRIGLCSLPSIVSILLIFPLCIGNMIGIIYSNVLIGHLYSAFAEFRWADVWTYMLYYLLMNLLVTFCGFFVGILKYFLMYYFRKVLTRNLLKGYFEGKNYYVILHMKDKAVDNPDQRIDSDVSEFCTNFGNILIQMINDVILLVGNTYSLFSSKGYFMLIPVVIWPILNTIFYSLLFNPVSKWVFKKDRFEGHFRYAHSRIREHSESMAFFQSEEREKENVETIFRKLVKTKLGLSLRYSLFNLYMQLSINMPTVCYIVCLVVMVFCDIPPFTQSMDIGEISDKAGFLYQTGSTLGNSISSLFSLSRPFSVVIGDTARIGQLIEAYDEIRKSSREKNKDEKLGRVIPDEDVIELQNVDIKTPKGKLLIKNVSFKVVPGQSLIIMGPSGSGKSSILRVLSGLWDFDRSEDGFIRRPINDNTFSYHKNIESQEDLDTEPRRRRKRKRKRRGMFFLPQKPYLIRGTLKENIIYPLEDDEDEDVNNCSDDQLREVLKLARVEYLLQRASLHETNIYWDEKSSLGEQQRIGLARVFFHRPKFVFLDESTSALDPENEKKVYSNLKKMGMTLISVAHRESVIQYHEQLLRVDVTGSLHLESIISPSNESSESVESSSSWEVVSSYVVDREERDIFEEDGKEEELELSDKKYGGSGINCRLVIRLIRLICGGIMIQGCCQWVFIIYVFLFSIMMALFSTPVLILQGTLFAAACGRQTIPTVVLTIVYFFLFFMMAVFYTWSYLNYVLQGIWFRVNLTKHMHSKYFRLRNFYRLNVLDKKVDNSDQRICQDVDYLTSGFDFTPGISYAESQLVEITTQLIGMLVAATIGGGYLVPIVGLAAFIFSLCCQFILIWFVSKYQFLQQKKEGYFRYSLTRMKEYSEQIAFFKGKELEAEIIEEKFLRMMKNQIILYFLENMNNSFNDFLVKVSSSCSYLLLAFEWNYNIGGIHNQSTSEQDRIKIVQQNMNYFQNSIICFVGILQASNTIGSCSGYVARVLEMIERLDDLEKEGKKKWEDGIQDIRKESKDVIEISNLDIYTPSKRKLIYNLNFSILKGQNWVIMGKSGSGKTSVIRTICGLWDPLIYDPNKDLEEEEDDGDNNNPNLSVIERSNSMRILEQEEQRQQEDDDIIRVMMTEKYHPRRQEIKCPLTVGKGGLFFLPQSPYLILGTLKENIIYPDLKSRVSDSQLLEILRQVNLEYIYNRYVEKKINAVYKDPKEIMEDEKKKKKNRKEEEEEEGEEEDSMLYQKESSLSLRYIPVSSTRKEEEDEFWNEYDDERREWSTILSPGEQQRIGMARLIYHRPVFAVLDESTSALDIENERLMYSVCKNNGISCLSIGHRVSLNSFHERKLLLDGEGGWAVLRKKEVEEVVEKKKKKKEIVWRSWKDI